MEEWRVRWGYEVRPTAVPGILALKGGGFLVHGKIGRKRRLVRVVREGSLRHAQRARQEMLDAANESPKNSMPRFAQYAQLLFDRKVANKELKSAASIERWEDTLTLHLVPAFGRYPLDQLTKLEIESWKTRISKTIQRGELKPSTANGWLSILGVILSAADADFGLPRDPMKGVKPFTTEEYHTYTRESPNSLTLETCSKFLAKMREKFPQFYAMTLLGFVTGLRPSSMRPLRRMGPEKDLDLDAGALEVRRSNSRRQAVMNTTKTGKPYAIGLSKDVVEVLRWHIESLSETQERSRLLFPAARAPRGRPGATPGMMSRSVLDKPFSAVRKAINLPFKLTPRGMRRTYQDIARASGVSEELQMAICGHRTEKMKEHYSTYSTTETAGAMERMAKHLLPPEVAAAAP